MKAKEKLKYKEGEKVLCFQGCLIYEAKVLKLSSKSKQPLYWVHYTGWKKKWDEWVNQARVLKHTAGNLERQKCLSDQQQALGKYRRAPPFLLGKESRGNSRENSDAKKAEQKQSTKCQPMKQNGRVELLPSASSLKKRREAALSAADAIRQSVSPVPPGEAKDVDTKAGGKRKSKESDSDKKKPRKRPLLPTVEDEEQWLNTVEVEIHFPAEAQELLYRDWENINEQQMVTNLPVRHTVTEILAAWANGESSDQKRVVQRKNLADSLKEYFNAMLSNHLLYEFEKPHHEAAVEQNREMGVCDLYGPVHLLRMFSKIGQMLAYTNLDRRCMKFYVELIGSFIEYLVKNFQNFGGFEDCFRAPAAYLTAHA